MNIRRSELATEFRPAYVLVLWKRVRGILCCCTTALIRFFLSASEVIAPVKEYRLTSTHNLDT